MENRIFYWMSRPAGTWCVKEREGVPAGHQRPFHLDPLCGRTGADQGIPRPVTGQKDGHIMGRSSPWTTRRRCGGYRQRPPTARIIVQYEGGHTATMPFPEHTRSIPTILPDRRHQPRPLRAGQRAELARAIMEEHRWQTGKVKKAPGQRRPHPGR